MKDLLELCIDLDDLASRTYRAMSEAVDDETLAHEFTMMGSEEEAHSRWWRDLLHAWEEGLVPDITTDREDLLPRLVEVREELSSSLPTSFEQVSTDEMLSAAARMEFFMLDPVFVELIEMTEPGGSTRHRDAYSRHVDRLVDLIEEHYSATDLARFLARMLRRAWRDYRKLTALAHRDQLTGLYNRRGMYSYLTHWISWSKRYDRPLGVMLIDVDHFKSVNDELGHLAGDDALRNVAEGLQRAVRDSDLVGRYGGDEFVVVAPETDEYELGALMNRIATEVASFVAVSWEGAMPVTVSVGGAYTRGDVSATPEALLAAADQSLYEAKAAGRGRAVSPRNATSVV
jgi:diguanylate cyclase (GGDEF)-like protein